MRRHAYVAEDMEIPPMSACWVPLCIPDVTKKKIPPGDGILEIDDDFLGELTLTHNEEALVGVDERGVTYTSIFNMGRSRLH